MKIGSGVARLVAGSLAVAGVAAGAEGAFVQFVTVVTQVTTGGVLLDQVRVFARFNGPTDTLLNAFDFTYQGGASVSVPDPYAAFYHKDNSSYSGGVLGKQYGTWAPTLTGSATLNRPYDSFLVIGGNASATNSTSADPSWNSGGSGAHAGNANGWNRADLLDNGIMGWFNSSPPTLQGRVGVAPNTATDVLVGQFVVDRGANVGYWRVTLGYNDGVAGSSVQFATASFEIACPAGNQRWRDADGDGFGSPSSVVVCSATSVPGYVPNNADCDDTNAAIHPNTNWYPDADLDGFGSILGSPVTQCVQPTAHALSNTDCNDNNAAINPNSRWYLDADGDGFGVYNSSPPIQCLQPPAHVLNSADCNDNNSAINPNTVWTRDVDGDGFGALADGTLTQCIQPAGYVLNNTDNCPLIANPDQADCNSNALGDVCELAAGQNDCNGNGAIDSCEIAAGLLADCDADATPDVCEGAVAIALSSALRPISSTGPIVEHTFTALPRVLSGSARITIEATADLGGATDGLSVTVDGGAPQTFFVSDGTDCPPSPNLGVINLSLAAANALVADGAMVVRVTAFGVVNSASCGASGGVRIKLAYLGLPVASDCNTNGLLDSCEIGTGAAPDCNGNGKPDSCDIASGFAQDCNLNGRPDSCDLAAGTSTDLDSNGTLDECSGEFVVGGSGFATVAAAIDAAPSGSVIRVGPGTYTGPLVILTKSLTLRSIAGAASTILSGSGLNTSILLINSPASVGTVIDGFTFRDGPMGMVAYSGPFRVGGAIYAISTTATITNCRFINNRAEFGGAIYGYTFSGTISNCLFDGNHATEASGAVQVGFGGDTVLSNNTFVNNSAVHTGGALQIVQGLAPPISSSSVQNCVFRNNTALDDAAAIAWSVGLGGDLPISGCTVESNTSPHAVVSRLADSTSTTARFVLANNRFCLNSASNFAGPLQDNGGNLFSQDCNGNGLCDADELSSGTAPDCNGNGAIDSCDIAGGAAPDCNGNAIPDSCDIAGGVAQDCNGNAIPDSCDLVSGYALDCNTNATPDSCDIATGVSHDVDSNGIPDECKPDCDGDGLPDAWELAQGLDADCDGNATIDRCDIAGGTALDCNFNILIDACELAANPALDCDGNGRLDSCDIAGNALLDCNTNGRIDACEIVTQPELDCDHDGQIDTCEIAGDPELDKNANGRLDYCELARGDLNLDGLVNGADLTILLNFWGFPNPPVGDLNGDGVVGGADITILLGNWGTTP